MRYRCRIIIKWKALDKVSDIITVHGGKGLVAEEILGAMRLMEAGEMQSFSVKIDEHKPVDTPGG